MDGCFVGLDVGAFVSALEGAVVVGEDVGWLVGALDGCFVGLDVGSLVGAVVVGADVLPCSANQSNV